MATSYLVCVGGVSSATSCLQPLPSPSPQSHSPPLAPLKTLLTQAWPSGNGLFGEGGGEQRHLPPPPTPADHNPDPSQYVVHLLSPNPVTTSYLVRGMVSSATSCFSALMSPDRPEVDRAWWAAAST